MQEVFEKIIEKLEEECFLTTNDDGETNELSIKVVDLNDAIEIVKQEAEKYNNRWISCSERLPEESLQSVIGWDAYRERCVFVQYLGVWKLGNWEEVDITHWMDVPHPPNGE